MKYFFDTEFIEGWKKPIKWLPTLGNFNKFYHSIQLISIGIVAEDGREYYAISNEFNPKDASDWVKENVLSKLPNINFYMNPGYMQDNPIYKSNKQIADDIICFCMPELYNPDKSLTGVITPKQFPKFYAYYADYDWVLFCSLFGTMMDLPKNFPMYCIDLKQSFDTEIRANITDRCFLYISKYRKQFDADKINKGDMIEVHEWVKALPIYPKQKNEHNALADAKWNKNLYDFLKSI